MRDAMFGGTINAVLIRIGRNTGWLLGSKGLGAVLSIAYLAIAARTLGPEGFGQFILVLTYAQAVANFVQFHSWQTLIRFGTSHAGDGERLARLIGFSAMLDAISEAAGALVAIAGAMIIGFFVDWTGAEQRNAALFGISLLFALRATPTGILRLFDRFDLAMAAESVLPVIRSLGALAAGGLSGNVVTFLLVWAAAELLTTLALWAVALRELARRKLAHIPRGSWLRTVVAETPGLWRFAWLTNASSTIQLVWRQAGTLAVAVVVNPATAGGYRLAQQIAQALSKPITSLARAGYPEFAHMVARGDPLLVTVIRRIMLLTVSAGAVLVVLVALFGHFVITTVAGDDFAFATPFLFLLSVAVAFELSGVVLEPLLLALGRPGRVLVIRTGAAAIYIMALAGMMAMFGAMGAAMGAVAGSMTLFIALAVATWKAMAGYTQAHGEHTENGQNSPPG